MLNYILPTRAEYKDTIKYKETQTESKWLPKVIMTCQKKCMLDGWDSYDVKDQNQYQVSREEGFA